MSQKILYSFRRCPYAMRARLALGHVGVTYEIREIDLKNKAATFLETSPKGTVPVLVLEDGTIIDESLDVVEWAAKMDPEGFGSLTEDQRVINDKVTNEIVLNFIPMLNRYKYHERYPEQSKEYYREKGLDYLNQLNEILENKSYLLGDEVKPVDYVAFPFVRQCFKVDLDGFKTEGLDNLFKWYEAIENSELFTDVMQKHEVFQG